jgi:hypothetical protein
MLCVKSKEIIKQAYLCLSYVPATDLTYKLSLYYHAIGHKEIK